MKRQTSKPLRLLLPFLCLAWTTQNCLAARSVARTWNEENLAAIRIDRPNPPVHARNLFHVAVAMYDAWAAYDDQAVGYLHHERVTAADLLAQRRQDAETAAAFLRPLAASNLPGLRNAAIALRRYMASTRYLTISAADIEASRREAISHAAYRVLRSRYLNSFSAFATSQRLDKRLRSLGYSAANIGTSGNSAAAVGNRIAASILAWGLADGSNQAGSYRDPDYFNPQPELIVLEGGIAQAGIPAGTDPNRWQPLAFDNPETQNQFPGELLQSFVGVTWLNTLPFALTRATPGVPWLDPGHGFSRLGSPTDQEYKQGALDLLWASSRLNSQEIIDISPGPGGYGNNPLGEDTGSGYELNPVTGKPYHANRVELGNFARVLAEFWADGPDSETPPGHWHKIANQVSDSRHLERRIGGIGEKVDRLEWDVKLYFAVAAATHDAACAAWSLKRYYESPRPITMIRYMASLGQSSDPDLPSYHPDGLPLEPGVAELVTAETAAPGGRHHGVGNPGEIVVYSWPGEPPERDKQTNHVRWIRALEWIPYQRKTFISPAFPGYISGHSTFSRAAAEILAAYTGSPWFPRGMGTFIARKNKFLVFERGPSQTVVLQWASYFDAADQAGLSRRFGGIHVSEDDYHGRVVGSQTGQQVWALVSRYWDGSILNDSVTPTVTPEGDDVRVTWTGRRGLYYAVQWSADGDVWSTVSPASQATETQLERVITPAPDAGIYRVVSGAAPF